ncbi:uncharacterized protein LOC143023899 [Oratosquilla oratoria]|uniref:uncharacterized protein LOC143023899 n=1 Tax=Oratosquilla oratoria TaxID=337810 RepID=UPI003F75D54E
MIVQKRNLEYREGGKDRISSQISIGSILEDITLKIWTHRVELGPINTNTSDQERDPGTEYQSTGLHAPTGRGVLWTHRDEENERFYFAPLKWECLYFRATVTLMVMTTTTSVIGGGRGGGGGRGSRVDASHVGPGARMLLHQLGINQFTVEDVGEGAREGGGRGAGGYPWPRSSPFFTVVRAPQEETYPDHEGRVGPAESPVYYIRLPPTSYYYVTNSLLEQDPAGEEEETFEQVPLDFTNNGRPTQMYHWTPSAAPMPSPTAPFSSRPGTSSGAHLVAQSEIHEIVRPTSKKPVPHSPSSSSSSSFSSPSSSSTPSIDSSSTLPSSASLHQPSPPFLPPAVGTMTSVASDTLLPTIPSSPSPEEFLQESSSQRVDPGSPLRPSASPLQSQSFPDPPEENGPHQEEEEDLRSPSAVPPSRSSPFSDPSKGTSSLLIAAASGALLPKKSTLYIRNKSRYNGRPAHVYVWKRGRPHTVQNHKKYLRSYR